MKIIKTKTTLLKSDGKLDIGLNRFNTEDTIDLLNNALSTTFKLLIKVWGYHWNMIGPSFHTNHLFFEELYEQLITDVDDLAERVRLLSGRAFGSLQEMMQSSVIVEQSLSSKIPSIMEMMLIISHDYDLAIRELRTITATLDKQKPSDDGNLNYLQDLITRREKSLWFLRSFIQTGDE